MTWCCRLQVDFVTHLLSIGRCRALGAAPSPILRVWLPVLQASFHGLQLCNIGSECCEKRTLKPLGTSPFSLGAAFKLHLGVLAWVLLPVLAHLSCWSWSWPPWLYFETCMQTCGIATGMGGSHWSVLHLGCCFWPALLFLLRYCGVVPCGSEELPVPTLSRSALGCLPVLLLPDAVFKQSAVVAAMGAVLWCRLTSIYLIFICDLKNDLEMSHFIFPRNEFYNIYFISLSFWNTSVFIILIIGKIQ